MKSIALFGEAQAGKTTIARWLEVNNGYTIVRNADNLKNLAANLYNKGEPIMKGGYYEITSPLDGKDVFISGRELLQKLGTSVKTYDLFFWLRWFLSDVDGKEKLVVDDGRFPFELDALKKRGWVTVRVQTPLEERMKRGQALLGRLPTESEMSHDSERLVGFIPLEHFDIVVPGTGDTGVTAESILELANET